MNLAQTYERAYRHAVNEDQQLARAGIPTLTDRDITQTHRATKARYWLEVAGKGEAEAWLQLAYHACSAYLASYEAEVVQVASGDEAA